MAKMVYQASVGDGFREKSLKRLNSYFKTAEEAVSEALALKEKIDSTYDHKIEWEYNKKIKEPSDKMKILRGYLSGDKKSKAFYLQIASSKSKKGVSVVKAKKPKTMTKLDVKMMNNIAEMFK